LVAFLFAFFLKKTEKKNLFAISLRFSSLRF